jgi:hypothetical protein
VNRKVVVAVVLALAALGLWRLDWSAPPTAHPPASSQREEIDPAEAYKRRASNVQVRGEGVVQRILPDDHKGSRHQRFLLRLWNGQTVLISHNIDLAPRISDLHIGDEIAFAGEYEWNEQGGLVHWTHRDPIGRHPGGWLRREGKKFE